MSMHWIVISAVELRRSSIGNGVRKGKWLGRRSQLRLFGYYNENHCSLSRETISWTILLIVLIAARNGQPI